MSDSKDTLTLPRAEMNPDMDVRYADKAFYYTMRDAMQGEGELKLVGQNVFRPEVTRPVVDDFIMDEKVILSILEKLNQQEPV